MPFSKIDFKLFFIVGSTSLFFSLPDYLNNSWWFSSSFSTFEDRRRISLKSCSILFKIHGSSFLPSSHNCFRLWELFSPIQSNSWVFSVLIHPKPIFSELFIPAFSSHSLNLTGAAFKYSLISSWSICSHVSNPLKYLHSFSNSSRCFFIFLLSFPILMVVRSRFLFLRYRINSFVLLLFQSYRWLLKTFSSLHYISLNPFYENK